MQWQVLPATMRALMNVSRCSAWSMHAHHVAINWRLASEICALALAHLRSLAVVLRLPPDRRPAGCMWDGAGWTAGLLQSGMLGTAVREWFVAADGASTTAVLAAAAQLVQQLPLNEQPASGSEAAEGEQPAAEPAPQERTLFYVACLPDVLCLHITAAVFAQQSCEQRRRVAAQVLPAVCRLPRLLQQLGSWPAGAPPEQQQGQLAALHSSARFLVSLLSAYGRTDSDSAPIVRSIAETLPWVDAACAALRCVPRVHSLLQEQEWSAAGADTLADFARAADDLATTAVRLLVDQRNLPDPPAAPIADALWAAWALHSALCRRLHFGLAASSAPFQLAGAEQLREALNVLGHCVNATRNLPSIYDDDAFLETFRRCACARLAS